MRATRLHWSGTMAEHRLRYDASGLMTLVTLLLLGLVLPGGGWTAHAARMGNDDGKRTYVVQMAKLEKPREHATYRSWYHATFASARRGATGNDAANKAAAGGAVVDGGEPHQHSEGILHVYENVFWGFAARLSAREVEALESMPSVLQVRPEEVRQLHTTHTPEFLGLSFSGGILVESDFGEDIIIGVIDTGVWPERSSYSDEGLSDIPSRWKGSCVQELSFEGATLCNKKLIGAKFYARAYEAGEGPIDPSWESRSPRDDQGHGTHTSSTCGGSAVGNASTLGFATGTARGIAPKSRLAVYKVCWTYGCYDADILAALDDAVADGVDVISLSVGGGVSAYYEDSIAIGAYGATKKGVVVSCSGGNTGPRPQTVVNVAPWILTVAASTVDRRFPAVVNLGNGESFEGTALYSGPGLGSKLLPFVYGAQAKVDGSPAAQAGACAGGTLDPAKVEGKIVLCDRGITGRVAKGQVCQAAGAVGLIVRNLATDGEGLIADPHVIPASAVGFQDGNKILEYVLSTDNATASISLLGTVLGAQPAPVVGSFSSRGPNSATPEILKPDITAPGVNILAAWTGAVGPTGLESDDREVEFNIISGTSMACPHISGVAALLKGARPAWSPAAIKSAIMTTSYVIDNSGVTIQDEATGLVSTPYAYGAGHVDPEKALDPGLIYDLGTSDYIKFVCSLDYPESAIQIIDSDVASCPDDTPAKGRRPYDLNYPSFSAVFTEPLGVEKRTISFNRTVTNVGAVDSTYTVSVTVPLGVQVTVEPSELKFRENQAKLPYTLDIEAKPVILTPGTDPKLFTVGDGTTTTVGSLAWTDGTHIVQSPIVITWPTAEESSYDRGSSHESMSRKAAL